MTGAKFGRALVVGFIATFVATIYGYWEVAVGLPKLDFAMVLGLDLAPEGASREFAYTLGMVQHFIDGMLLALIFVRLFVGFLPGHYLLKGLVFGIIVWVGSSLVASPIHGAGLFWIRWRVPALVGVFVWHIIWGIALGVTYYLALPKNKEGERW